MIKRIYTDHAATTFLCDEAFDAMLPYLKESFGNPSSIHSFGEDTKNAVEKARSAIADNLNCQKDQVIFTSGGTESDNHAMSCLANYGKKNNRNVILISGGEHHAVGNAAKELNHVGMEIITVPLEFDGTPSPSKICEIAANIGDNLCGGSFMMANNETGSIFDIRLICKVIHDHGGLFHTDAVQAVGHIPIDFQTIGADFLSLSAHKFHGPKGVGALICRDPDKIVPIIRGGGQESGRRAGTENVAGIVGMAAALSASAKNISKDILKVTFLRERLKQGLSSLPGAHFNGGGLPGILSVRFDNADGEALVRSLDLYGIAASSGAACNSVEVKASHVLLSMGLTDSEASSTVRFSLDSSNTEDEIDRIIKTMEDLLC